MSTRSDITGFKRYDKSRYDMTMTVRIKNALVAKFNASTAKDKSIVITMKADNVPLIITPDWNFGQKRDPELADAFTVYVDVAKGRASVPYMASTSITDMADKIEHYRGIDLEDEDGVWIRLMTMAPHYQMAYDMYDEEMRAAILAMQNPETQKFLHEEFVEEDCMFM